MSMNSSSSIIYFPFYVELRCQAIEVYITITRLIVC
jgi:hypothetical protein